jgi:hypothetical protein
MLHPHPPHPKTLIEAFPALSSPKSIEFASAFCIASFAKSSGILFYFKPPFKFHVFSEEFLFKRICVVCELFFSEFFDVLFEFF